MNDIKVFRQGKSTFCEWHIENGHYVGRIMNQGAGVFMDDAFSTAEEAKAFCETELEKDASLDFYILKGENIIDFVRNDAYHDAVEAKENRIFVVVTAVIVMLLASVVSFSLMPFQLVIYDALFIVAMGILYLVLNSIGGRMNIEGVVLMLIILILVSVMVPMLSE